MGNFPDEHGNFGYEKSLVAAIMRACVDVAPGDGLSLYYNGSHVRDLTSLGAVDAERAQTLAEILTGK